MSNWLVIGASSFTGSHFCRLLENHYGHTVQRVSLANWLSGPRKLDYIVNFAALNVVAPSWDHPADYFRVNVIEQIPIFEYLRKYPHIKYVHVSTPEVFGSHERLIGEYDERNPSTPYAASRAAAEQLLHAYALQYNLSVAVTRGCNVYGPGQQLYRLIPKLVCSIRKGIKFPLEGGGRSRRSWCHVYDMCEAIYRVAKKGIGPYHISPVELLSIDTLARKVCEAMKVKLEDVCEKAPERPGKDACYRLNADAIRKLGWAPQIGIDSGIREVVEWVDREWESLKDQPMEYEFRP